MNFRSCHQAPDPDLRTCKLGTSRTRELRGTQVEASGMGISFDEAVRLAILMKGARFRAASASPEPGHWQWIKKPFGRIASGTQEECRRPSRVIFGIAGRSGPGTSAPFARRVPGMVSKQAELQGPLYRLRA
jgi:hypothetical protein